MTEPSFDEKLRSNYYYGPELQIPGNVSKELRNKLIAEQRAVSARFADEFHEDLMDECRTRGNPKEGRLFGIAWEQGHSSGFHEVANYYREMADLIDPVEPMMLKRIQKIIELAEHYDGDSILPVQMAEIARGHEDKEL